MPVPSLSFPFVNDCSGYSLTLDPGFYLFEAWGASGGNDEYGGRGAYIKGKIHIYESTNFQIFVGGKGGESIQTENEINNGGCNGGGSGGLGYNDGSYIYYAGGGGGGSTDIKTSTSHETRILVAAGGGGCSGLNKENWARSGGYGGDEIGGIGEGLPETNDIRNPANQTFGYQKFQGENGRSADNSYSSGAEGNGGGGGGYFGGGAGCVNSHAVTSGSGGSSYVSGHPSCIAIDEKSTNNDNIIFLDSSIHYSTYFFHRPFMVNGGTTILEPNRQPSVGHIGSGFVKITILELSKCSDPKELHLSLCVLIILF